MGIKKETLQLATLGIIPESELYGILDWNSRVS